MPTYSPTFGYEDWIPLFKETKQKNKPKFRVKSKVVCINGEFEGRITRVIETDTDETFMTIEGDWEYECDWELVEKVKECIQTK